MEISVFARLHAKPVAVREFTAVPLTDEHLVRILDAARLCQGLA